MAAYAITLLPAFVTAYNTTPQSLPEKYRPKQVTLPRPDTNYGAFRGDYEIYPEDVGGTYNANPISKFRFHIGHAGGQDWDITMVGVGIPDYIMSRFPVAALQNIAKLVADDVVEVKLNGAGTALTEQEILNLSFTAVDQI